MDWQIAEAREKFSELMCATIKQPQRIYNRDRLIAFMVKADEYEEFQAWRSQQQQSTIADGFTELQRLCLSKNYPL